MKVEMTKSLDGDQGVRVNDDGRDSDQGEDDQEEVGDQGNRALHQKAVGGKKRF